jgi:hypothetical protein
VFCSYFATFRYRGQYIDIWTCSAHSVEGNGLVVYAPDFSYWQACPLDKPELIEPLFTAYLIYKEHQHDAQAQAVEEQ